MKDLLNDIVEKMNVNLIEKSPSGSDIYQLQKSPHGSSVRDYLINYFF